MNKLLTVGFVAALCGTFAAAQQVGCLANTSSVIGTYTYVATEMPMSGVAITPPGTTTGQQTYSNTPVGQFVSAVNGGGPFSMAGSVYFDGAGHIDVASASAPLSPSIPVGTYTVNSDCTIGVTITDVFNTATPTAGVTVPTFGSTSLVGIVLGGGTELDLSMAQTTSSKNGNTPIVTGEFASRLFIQLIRSFPYGCSTTSLTGSYGLVGTGFAMAANSSTTQPVTFFASVNFDGNGNVVAQPVASGSPLAAFQYSGTYTVNTNCTGTLTFNAPPVVTGTAPTGTTPTPIITASFVLIPPVAYVTTGTAVLTGSADRASLLFTTSNSTETISGYGRAQ